MKKRFVYKENCIVSDKKKNVQLEVNEEEEKKYLQTSCDLMRMYGQDHSRPIQSLAIVK